MTRPATEAPNCAVPANTEDVKRILEMRIRRDRAQSIGYHSRVSKDRRYLCMTVPKVACTTVKLALQQLEGRSDPGATVHIHEADYSRQVHESGPRLADLDTGELLEVLTAPDWFRFCFVRNPYHRLFSAYKSKIINRGDQQYRWLRDQIGEAYTYPKREGATPMISFRDFVRYLRDTDDDRVRYDGHLNTQSDILMWGTVQYVFVGRFEQFAAHLGHALERIGAPQEIVAIAGLITNPTPRLAHAAVYDRELAHIAHEIYRADFDNFDYHRDSWMFEPG